MLRRSSMLWTLLLVPSLHASPTDSAVLQLGGESSEIRFGNGAVLNSRCPAVGPTSLDQAASWGFLEMQNTSVKVHLVGVPPSCAGLSMTTPCASASAQYPGLFHCAWSKASNSSAEAAPKRSWFEPRVVLFEFPRAA